jgi:HK97 family phage major capsid protein
MIKFIKYLKELMAKGFATATEKEELNRLFKELSAEEQEVQKEEVENADKLPETDPEAGKEADEAVEQIKGFVKSNISLELSKAKGEIEKDLADWKAKQEKLIEAKAGAYAPDLAAKRAKTNTYLRELSKAVLVNDNARIKELTSGNAGEYIVDNELSAEIRHLVTEYGVARREFFNTALSKNEYDANVLVTDVAVGWVSEGGVIGTSYVTLTQKPLKLKKLAAIASMSRELLEDSEIDLFSFIAERVAEGFAKAEDTAFFTGTGPGDTSNGEFDGLLHDTNVEDIEEYSSLAGITAENLFALVDALPEGAHPNAKFYFNRTWRSKIALIQDGDGRYIFQNPLSLGTLPTLIGYPAVTVEVMPDSTEDDGPFILFGDLRKACILGYKNGIAVDRFNAGVVRNTAGNTDVNLITTDREAVRWISRVGYVLVLPSAVKRLAPSGS